MEEARDDGSRIAELEAKVRSLEEALAHARRVPPGEHPAVAQFLNDRAVLSQLPAVIMLLDRQHRVLYVNRVAPGRTVEQLIGTCVLDWVPEDIREAKRALIDHVWNTGETVVGDTRSVLGYVWENSVTPLWEDGKIAYVLTTAIDSTPRHRAEGALRERETQLRHAIEATGLGTWSSDFQNGRIECDDRLCEIHGLAPAEAPTTMEQFVELVHPDDRARFATSIERIRKEKAFGDLEFRILRRDGSVRHVSTRGSIVLDDAGAIVRSYGGVLDVTERRELEATLRHVQKMEAIGELTAGIAHNFNNLLSVILPNVDLARFDATPGTHARLDAIAHAGERGAELVRQLMIFARRDGSTAKEPVDLAQCARRTLEICRTTFDRRVALELTVEDAVPSVLANAGQIEQVLINVCLNARDALESAGRDAPRIGVHVEAGPPGLSRIRVVDNGPGIDAATRARLFEPFFTTKGVDRGTGLGLATAYAIVADHEGEIRCESEPGAGATFVIELPSTERVATPAVRSDAFVDAGGTETLLVVDDESLVRAALRDTLELGGYRVLEARDGVEGLELFARERDAIDAVIVDRLMPGVSGEQVLWSLKAIDSTLPVVLLSGHPGSDERLARADAVLAKPVSADVLFRTVRAALDARALVVR